MKILCDEDLLDKDWTLAVERMKADQHDVVCVFDPSHGLRGLDDHELGKIATEQERLMVTKDKRTFQYDNFKHDQTLPSGLMVLQLQDLSPEARAERVSSFIQQHGESLHNNSTVLEPATERIKPMEQAYQEFQQKAEVEQQQSQEPTQTQSTSLKL